jgi:hypothetical protein
MTSLRYLNTVLTVLALLLAAQLYTSWTAAPTLVPEARADGIVDLGAVNVEMLGQLKALNAKVDQLSTMFATGKARVAIVNTEPSK